MPANRHITPLTRGRDPVAQRVAAYVNEHFDGNISQASMAIGCRYDALYHVARGARRPSADFLVKLFRHSGRSIEWWMTGEESP